MEGDGDEERIPTRPGRALMYTLVSLQGLPHWTIRSGLPAWVPILVADLRLSEAQRAMLLAAWFPGYICSQIPGAVLIQFYGPKLILGLTMVGTCGVFMLLPWLAQLGRSTAASVRIMAACLTVCGFCQGPLIPGQVPDPLTVSAHCGPVPIQLLLPLLYHCRHCSNTALTLP
jgi:hypothetical protein